MSASYLLNGDPANLKINPIFLGAGAGSDLNSVLTAGNDAKGLGMVNVSSITANAKIGTQSYQYYPQVVLNSGTDIIPEIEAPVIDNSQLIAVHGFAAQVGFKDIPIVAQLNKPMHCCLKLEGDDVMYFGGEDGVWAWSIGTDQIYKILTTYEGEGVGGVVYSLSIIYKNTPNDLPLICAGGEFQSVAWVNDNVEEYTHKNISMAQIQKWDTEYDPMLVYPDLIAETPFPAEAVYALGANDTGDNSSGFLWGGLANADYEGMGFLSTYGQFDSPASVSMTYIPAFPDGKSVFTIIQSPTPLVFFLGGDMTVTTAGAGTVTTGIVPVLTIAVTVTPAQPTAKLTVGTTYSTIGGAHYLTKSTAGASASCRGLAITGTGAGTDYIVACGTGGWQCVGIQDPLADSIAYIQVSGAGNWVQLGVPAVVPAEGYSCCCTVYDGTRVAIGALEPAVQSYVWSKTTPATNAVAIEGDGETQTNPINFITPYAPYEFFTANDNTVNTGGKCGQAYVFPDGETFILSAKNGEKIFFVPKGWGTPPSASADVYNTITVPEYGTVFSMLGDVAQGGVWRMMSSSDQSGVEPSNV